VAIQIIIYSLPILLHKSILPNFFTALKNFLSFRLGKDYIPKIRPNCFVKKNCEFFWKQVAFVSTILINRQYSGYWLCYHILNYLQLKSGKITKKFAALETEKLDNLVHPFKSIMSTIKMQNGLLTL
jgi:hypothetical protein